MAWTVKGNDLTMAEGDWGISLPVTINGTTLTLNDRVKITIKDKKNGETVIEKDFDNIQDNTFSLEFTEAESEKLPVGAFAYSMDWYQDGAFLCNIIPLATLKVVDKA